VPEDRLSVVIAQAGIDLGRDAARNNLQDLLAEGHCQRFECGSRYGLVIGARACILLAASAHRPNLRVRGHVRRSRNQ